MKHFLLTNAPPSGVLVVLDSETPLMLSCFLQRTLSSGDAHIMAVSLQWFHEVHWIFLPSGSKIQCSLWEVSSETSWEQQTCEFLELEYVAGVCISHWKLWVYISNLKQPVSTSTSPVGGPYSSEPEQWPLMLTVLRKGQYVGWQGGGMDFTEVSEAQADFWNQFFLKSTHPKEVIIKLTKNKSSINQILGLYSWVKFFLPFITKMEKVI